jgi:hypothetical protein
VQICVKFGVRKVTTPQARNVNQSIVWLNAVLLHLPDVSIPTIVVEIHLEISQQFWPQHNTLGE